jgi:hypothetical protein
MELRDVSVRGLRRSLALLLAAALAACGGGESKQAQAPAPEATAAVGQPAEAPAPLQASGTTWTPEELEALAAPIALYPDPVLAQVLIASTNPQEVMDAGNWLLQNQGLEGSALDDAAMAVGFTPPTRALVQFPQVVDMMCLQIDWTAELGQAFVDDQAGVLDAVQRLRAQAQDVGTLQSTPQMTVETETQGGQEVITVAPPSPEVVYVPQYDPVAAYNPSPEAVAATTAAATTAAPTTTTVTEESKGHSTGSLVATGVLAFGAGILVNEIFDDDDDWYRHNNYYYGGMPYYPPYPYRPVYGGGYYPSHGYNRPPNYGGNWGSNNTVIINNNNNYWNSYNRPGGSRPGVTTTRAKAPQSPITAAKKSRPELAALNAEAKKGPKRTAPAQTADWKGQGGYAGARDKAAGARPAAASQPAAKRDAAKPAPKVQGSYAGAKDRTPAAKPAARPAERPVAKPAAKPDTRPAAQAAKDRGYAKPESRPAQRPAATPAAKPVERPAAKPAQTPQQRPAATPASRPTAVSGNRQGGNAKAASQRGKQSMPKGVPPKAKAQRGNKKAGR